MLKALSSFIWKLNLILFIFGLIVTCMFLVVVAAKSNDKSFQKLTSVTTPQMTRVYDVDSFINNDYIVVEV